MAKDYYSLLGNGVGGSLHVVLDDGNLKDYHIQWCLNYALEKGDTQGMELAKALLRASWTQRTSLYKQYSLYSSPSKLEVIMNIDTDHNLPKAMASRLAVMGVGCVSPAFDALHHNKPIGTNSVILVDSNTQMPVIGDSFTSRLHAPPLLGLHPPLEMPNPYAKDSLPKKKKKKYASNFTPKKKKRKK